MKIFKKHYSVDAAAPAEGAPPADAAPAEGAPGKTLCGIVNNI